MSDYELIIIGAGPGGYEAALRAAELGMKTAIIEKDKVGGTCLNRGCVPTKSLLHASNVFAAAGKAASYGVSLPLNPPEIGRMFEEKKKVTERLREGVEGLLKEAGVQVFYGTGTVCGPGRVLVNGAEGKMELTCEKVLIAAGMVPAKPPIPGIDLDGVLTSDDILEGDGESYSSLTIIGGGVIGVELATFYAELGCRVAIIEGMDRLLPNLDKEIGQNLASILKKKGIEVYTKARVMQMEQKGGAVKVTFIRQNREQEIESEKVLCAVGRTPRLEGLFGEPFSGSQLQPEMNGRQIKVNERFETSIPGIYAIGDISSRIQLAHAAAAQGRACVEMMAGKNKEEDLSVIPGCIFTRPEIASAGLSLEEARAQGIRAESGKYVMFSNARTMIAGAPRSFIKVVAATESHKILGAQLMCENATDMISEFTMAIVNGLTAEQMLLAVRPHPTFEEGVANALRAVLLKLEEQR